MTEVRMEEQRKRVVEEIVQTETTFVADLNVVIEFVINPIRKANVLSASELANVFSNLEAIYNMQSTFLGDLQKSKAEDDGKGIGALFKDFAPYFRMFAQYLNNFEHALDELQRLKKEKPRVAALVAEAEANPACKGLQLNSFLIMPVQRIPRYKLLLENLLKYTAEDAPARKNVQIALDLVAEAAAHNNEMIRMREKHEKMLELQREFEHGNKKINLLDTLNRTFIREGLLEKLCRRGPKPFTFWLFNDRLLYGEGTKGQYKLHRILDLSVCSVSDVQLEEFPNRAFVLESPQKSFIVIAQQQRQRDEWVNDLSSAIMLTRENPRRLSTASNTADETTACTICQTQFTMTNRRYTCKVCEGAVCKSCSGHKFMLSYIDSTKPSRVCDRCVPNVIPDAEPDDEEDKRSRSNSGAVLAQRRGSGPKGLIRPNSNFGFEDVYVSPDSASGKDVNPLGSNNVKDEDRGALSSFMPKGRRHSSGVTEGSTKNKSIREKLGMKKASLDMNLEHQSKRGTLRDFFKPRASITKDSTAELSINVQDDHSIDSSTVRSDAQTPYFDLDDDGRSLRSSESESVKSPPGRITQVPQRRRSSNSTTRLFGAMAAVPASNEAEAPASGPTDDELLAPITQRLLGGIAATNRRVSVVVARGLSDSDSDDGDDAAGYAPNFSATDEPEPSPSSNLVPGFSAFDAPAQFTATDEPIRRPSESTSTPSSRPRGRRSGIGGSIDPAALRALEGRPGGDI